MALKMVLHAFWSWNLFRKLAIFSLKLWFTYRLLYSKTHSFRWIEFVFFFSFKFLFFYFFSIKLSRAENLIRKKIQNEINAHNEFRTDKKKTKPFAVYTMDSLFENSAHSWNMEMLVPDFFQQNKYIFCCVLNFDRWSKAQNRFPQNYARKTTKNIQNNRKMSTHLDKSYSECRKMFQFRPFFFKSNFITITITFTLPNTNTIQFMKCWKRFTETENSMSQQINPQNSFDWSVV